MDILFCFLKRRQVEEKTLRNENTQIFYRLQTLLTRANLSKLSQLGHKKALFPFYQVFICKTHNLL